MLISLIVPVFRPSDQDISGLLESVTEALDVGIGEVIFVAYPHEYMSIRAIKSKYSFVVRQIVTEEPGIFHAQNRGLRVASGKYSLIIGVDDRIVVNPRSACLDIKEILVRSNKDLLILFHMSEGRVYRNGITWKTSFVNTVHQQSVLYLTDRFKSGHSFREDLRLYADYALVLQASRGHFTFEEISYALVDFCLNGVTGRKNFWLVGRASEFGNILWREWRGWNRIASIVFMIMYLVISQLNHIFDLKRAWTSER